MAKGPQKNTINKSQDSLTTSEHSYPTTASPGYSNKTKTQENSLKYKPVKMDESYTEEMNKSLKEKQENAIKQIEVFKKERDNFLKTFR